MKLSETYLDYYTNIKTKEKDELSEDSWKYFTFGEYENDKNKFKVTNENFIEYYLN
jgi:hypothetical protein